MPYEIELDRTVQTQLTEMPPVLRNAVIDRLLDLRDEADIMCRPSFFPYPPGYLLDEFLVKNHANPIVPKWKVTILLEKSQGGKLLIYKIPWHVFP